MNKVIERFRADRSALPLPKIAKTRSGVKFKPNDALWAFRDGINSVYINFHLFPDACAPLLLGLKKTLIWYLENRAAATANRVFADFLNFIRFVANDGHDVIQHIAQDDVLIYKMSSVKAAHTLASLRGFLRRWVKLGAPGIGQDVDDFLKRLYLKQHPVGVAVATLDPKKGPLTDLEFEAIQVALNSAYARDEVDVEKLLLCYLLMSLGARPAQIASLKCGDLIVPVTPGGDYVLNVPRVKQDDQLGRSEFKARRLTPQIGEPLAVYVNSIRTEFGGKFLDTSQAPMFPQRKAVGRANAPGFEFHQTPGAVSTRVVKVFSSLRVPSERVQGLPMRITAIRLRRTFATRAAEEGWPLLVLAELMDHSSTRHVEVYASLTTRIRATFSRKIAMDMAPLAMAFGGKIIRSEEAASRPGPASRIIDLRIDQSGGSMGSCGSDVYCGFARPIACYGGCHDFEPWLDGPHDAALDYMLARREYLMATTDPRMAAINDRAILGCAQVVLRCRQILAKEGK